MVYYYLRLSILWSLASEFMIFGIILIGLDNQYWIISVIYLSEALIYPDITMWWKAHSCYIVISFLSSLWFLFAQNILYFNTKYKLTMYSLSLNIELSHFLTSGVSFVFFRAIMHIIIVSNIQLFLFLFQMSFGLIVNSLVNWGLYWNFRRSKIWQCLDFHILWSMIFPERCFGGTVSMQFEECAIDGGDWSSM